MLQPHNYSQIMRRNLYNVAYRRSGAYKGMGQMVGAQCPSFEQLMGVVDPADPCQAGSAGTAEGSTAGVVPGTPASAWGSAPTASGAPAASGLTIPSNALPWVIGGGLLFVLLLAGRR